jgi:ABC-type transporter MlaC component
VFETYISKVYAAQLSTYSGEKFEVTRGEAEGSGAPAEGDHHALVQALGPGRSDVVLAHYL